MKRKDLINTLERVKADGNIGAFLALFKRKDDEDNAAFFYRVAIKAGRIVQSESRGINEAAAALVNQQTIVSQAQYVLDLAVEAYNGESNIVPTDILAKLTK